MTERTNQHHWFTYQGKQYTLRGLCQLLKVDYPNHHKKVLKNPGQEDYSRYFGKPEGTILPYTPTTAEISELKRNNRTRSQRSTGAIDTTPPAVAQFLRRPAL